MNQKILVLTNSELGWDCVCGAFTSYEKIAEYLEILILPGSTAKEQVLKRSEELGSYIVTEVVLNWGF